MPASTYKPMPGSIPSRVLELLRWLPKGTALNAPELRARLEINVSGPLSAHLQIVRSHGLLKATKRPDQRGRLCTYWSAP